MVGLNVSNLLESKAALIHLRTVRVTAAVYWALSLELLQIIQNSPLPFSFQHRAGVRLYT